MQVEHIKQIIHYCQDWLASDKNYNWDWDKLCWRPWICPQIESQDMIFFYIGDICKVFSCPLLFQWILFGLRRYTYFFILCSLD